jgi:hypothetical protein
MENQGYNALMGLAFTSIKERIYTGPPGKEPPLSEGETRIITHPIVDAIGPTTNALVIGFLINNLGEKYTRESIRIAIEGHKKALLDVNPKDQHASRIRDGKATVNYWIDRLVESDVLGKLHSNPVRFWANEENQMVKAFITLNKPKSDMSKYFFGSALPHSSTQIWASYVAPTPNSNQPIIGFDNHRGSN